MKTLFVERLNILIFSGSAISTVKTNTAVRTCNFSYSGRMILFSTDNTMRQMCEMHIVDTDHMATGRKVFHHIK